MRSNVLNLPLISITTQTMIESAAVRIGDDILEVSGYGGYMVNGISNAELPMKLSDQYLLTHTQKSEKESIFEIVLSEATAETIVIRSFKDLVGIKFSNASPDTFGTSVGLMGSFANGDRLSRNGTIMEDANEFGQEWQVRDTEGNLFQTARAPQYPEKIQMPDSAASETRKRRLGEAAIDEEAATLACAHHSSEAALAMCVYDVMATGDLELAHGGVF